MLRQDASLHAAHSRRSRTRLTAQPGGGSRQPSKLAYKVAAPCELTLHLSAASAGETLMTTQSIVNAGHLRSQLTAISRNAELAFERAFDLQQAGAPAERVDAALAEIRRLQESARSLRDQLGEPAVLH